LDDEDHSFVSKPNQREKQWKHYQHSLNEESKNSSYHTECKQSQKKKYEKHKHHDKSPKSSKEKEIMLGSTLIVVHTYNIARNIQTV